MKLAPWLCLGALLVIVATFMYNKFYIVALFGAPIVGLLCFAMFLTHWRTGKDAFANFVAVLFIMVSISSAQGGLLWGVPQSLAVVTLFMTLPMLLFNKSISRWLSRGHG